MQAPLVSVVIPCYAQAHFLADAIRSARAQQHPAHEIIVVDDGSPDDVEAITRDFPEIRLIRQDNRGLSRARNRGLAESRGDYVVFLDADDRLLPNALSAGVAAFQQHPDSVFVWGSRRHIDANGAPLAHQPDYSYRGRARYELLLLGNTIGPPVTVMFRRSVLLAAGGFSPVLRRSEDYELFLHLVRDRATWCHGELVAEYRLHEGNMSNDHLGMLVGSLQALDLQEAWIGDDVELRRALREGRRLARLHYSVDGRMFELSRHVRAGRWVRALLAGWVLLIRHPGRFAPVLARRVKRALLSGTT